MVNLLPAAMLLLYNCSRSGNLAADSANIVVNQGLMAFHLYQQPGNYDEGSCSITCVTWVWVVWQKKKSACTNKSPTRGTQAATKESHFFDSIQPAKLWPSDQLSSVLSNDPVCLWITVILWDLARGGVQDSWSDPIWWTNSPFFPQ